MIVQVFGHGLRCGAAADPLGSAAAGHSVRIGSPGRLLAPDEWIAPKFDPCRLGRVATARRLILGIENSNPDRGPGGFHGEVALACSEGKRIVALGREPLNPASERDDDVMPAIDRLFRSAGCRPADLGAVAVSIGPGGFTGLRIATVTAKALAESLGCQCFAVPTAEALARGVEPSIRASRRLAVCLAWKNESVWCTRFRPDGTAGSAELVPFERVLEPAERLDRWAIVADDRLVARLRVDGLVPEGAAVISPAYDALAVIEAAEGLDPVEPTALAPLYPREPEAVTKWRALHPR